MTLTKSNLPALALADAQVHIWASDRPDRRWVSAPPSHRPSFDVAEALREMDLAGVSRAVVVPPSFEGNRNDFVLAACASHPGRIGAMGRVSLDDPVRGEALVRTWRSHPGALGFRLTLAEGSDANRARPGSWLTDGSADWLWPVAAECGIPVMAYCTGLLTEIATVASRHRGLRLAIDHLGLPPVLRDDAEVARRLEELRPLADLPNIAVKIGPLPCYTSEQYPWRSLQASLRRVVDWFGPHRVFWASDMTRLPCPYAAIARFFREEMPYLDAASRALICGQGLLDWLDWR